MLVLPVLRQGSTGPFVALLQSTLKRQGLFGGDVDGKYNSDTIEAVIAHQRSMGLPTDGIVGSSVWRSLRNYVLGYSIYRARPNDTIHAIAQNAGISTRSLIAANPSIQPDRLFIGMELVVPTSSPIVYTDIPYTFEVLELNLFGLKKRYPFLSIKPQGKSVSGRTLYSVDVGQGDTAVFYNASHHANEWITTVVLMKYLENFCAAIVDGLEISHHSACEIYLNRCITLMPMVNPDGVQLVTEAITANDPEYKRAAAIDSHGIPFPSGWKANIRGVDLNLNYPAGWEIAKEIKAEQGFTGPSPRDYVGPSPLSEPESTAVANLTKASDYKLILAYHTQGKEIYWKYADFDPPYSLEIAEKFAEVSGYTVAETPFQSGHAGYKDWFIMTYNRPGYTIEAGLGANPLPLSQFEEIYNDNEGILTLGAVV